MKVLHSVAPQKTRKTYPYKQKLGSLIALVLKKICRNLEHKWQMTKQESDRSVWAVSYKSYKHALSAARITNFSDLINTNRNNPRFLFETFSKLTKKYPPTQLLIHRRWIFAFIYKDWTNHEWKWSPGSTVSGLLWGSSHLHLLTIWNYLPWHTVEVCELLKVHNLLVRPNTIQPFQRTTACSTSIHPSHS